MRYKVYRLDRSQVVPQSLNDVFPFFANAGNLELLTPKFLHFRLLTPLPICMKLGTLIDYRLQLFSFPFHWRTRIEVFEPGRCFTDVQVSGPYRRWRHLHEFTTVPEGTLVHDVVDYELPLGPLGALAHVVFVRRTLEKIFDYRKEQIRTIFGGSVL